MKLTTITPAKALNKAYYRQSEEESNITLLSDELKSLFSRIDEKESEENLKNIVADFLKNVWYGKNYEINTKDRKDLVIHNGKLAKDTIGVIIEAKRPLSPEQITVKNPNNKAIQELILYYFEEREEKKNIEIKHLVTTNIFEWFIFNESDFDKIFYRNTQLKKLYDVKQQQNKDNPFFYAECEKIIDNIDDELPCVYLNLKDYSKYAENRNKKTDESLADLYKVLTPQHLLKLPFANDSNQLNKQFYYELLHIIGLYEHKDGSKKIIARLPEKERNMGSLLENAIHSLKSEEVLSKIKNKEQFGENDEDQYYSIALELCITWLNRILFLKLLEGQLIKYHEGDETYAFLNIKFIHDFDSLQELFFDVLAVEADKRESDVKEKYKLIPYLNSSLFDRSDLEKETVRINQLKDYTELSVFSSTVLKDKGTSKRREGSVNTIEYIFEFLDAYDFSNDSRDRVKGESKSIINASVLGLIFEKINGYKDGSFFTPGYITMYMCRETIRRAIVQKFNDNYTDWNCKDFNDLYNKLDKIEIKKANEIINSLKICDPAVGSGHFLVSALNEIIACKNELDILADKEGKRLKGYYAEVENDELVISDESGIFEYHYKDKESQRIQETIFHEKQAIIENCLFGVDINPKSVQICRLRLWIELLKNAYYKKGNQLETLPNIDINIKCGNSLISRFPINYDLSKAIKSIKYGINQYREFVKLYIHSKDKEEKKGYESILNTIKQSFKIDIDRENPKIQKINKLSNKLYNLFSGNMLFEPETSYGNDKQRKKEREKLEEEINNLQKEIDAERNAEIYRNAFEWRFEFPEVLDEKGNFIGFDIVVGNPPYGVKTSKSIKNILLSNYKATEDIYTIFIERGLTLLHENGIHSFINPISWLNNENYITTRSVIADKYHLIKGIILPYDIFEDAFVDTGIFIFDRKNNITKSEVYQFSPKDEINIKILFSIKFTTLTKDNWVKNSGKKIILDVAANSFQNKLSRHPIKIGDITKSCRGILAKEDSYSNSKMNNKYKTIFIGKLNRYCIESNDFAFVRYDDDLTESPKSYNFFEDERILIRRIVNRQFRIMAHLIDEEFVNKKDIYIFKTTNDNDYPNKLLIAIINSKLISYFKTQSSTSAKKDDFTQITLNDIREISIPENYNKYKNPLILLVSKIIQNKKSNPQSDTSDLEEKIDQLIYELYGLTKEEIKIIDQNS